MECVTVDTDTNALLALRQVRLPLKHCPDMCIGMTVHLPTPKAQHREYDRGPNRRGPTRTFSVRRLSTSRNDYVNPRGKKNTLEDAWSTDLTTLDAAMRKAHSYADPSDQVS